MDYLKDAYTYYIQYNYLQTHRTENFFHLKHFLLFSDSSIRCKYNVQTPI